jgi:eukaryotic-like serine/threonine-protein kinase
MTLRGGRYEIIRVIASGGMAQVCLGRALGAGGFERLVAIKAMHAHLAAEPDFVDMFLDEARLAARIRHPNVVATLDVQQDEAGLFLVMEYVEGPALQSVLRQQRRARRKLPLDLTLRIFLDALAGLHAAHELTGADGEPLNLVHRDISPHNILVGVDGVARLTDFGVAHAESRLSTTRGAEVKGKFPYMAQEQIQRAPIDRRTDIYAAGAVFWEMLAGERLVRGDNDGQLLTQILKAERRSVQALNPAVPEEIEAVCQRALQREPDDRHATAAAFGAALEAAAKAAGVAIAAPRDVATFVKELKAHESPTDSPSGSLRKPAQSASRAAITAPASTGSVHSEVGPLSTHAAAIAPVAVAPARGRGGLALIAAAAVALTAGAVAALLLWQPRSPRIAEPAAATTTIAPNIAPADRDAPRPEAAPVPGTGNPTVDASTAAPASSASSLTAGAAPPRATGTPKAKATPAAPRPTAASPTHFRPTEL